MERNILKVYIQTYTRPKKENLKHDTVVNTFFFCLQVVWAEEIYKNKKTFLFVSFIRKNVKKTLDKKTL